MLFYQFTGKLKDETSFASSRDLSARQERRAKAAMIKLKTEQFNSDESDGAFRFVSNISDGEVLCGAIANDRLDMAACAERFFATVGIEAELVFTKEALLQPTLDMLAGAERELFIGSDDEVLSRYDISRLGGHALSHAFLHEKMLNETSDVEELYAKSRDAFTGETLIPELDRIFASEKKEKHFGHPVHYLIESDDSDASETITETLLSALYMQKRIVSRRYLTFYEEHGDGPKLLLIDSLFESSTGGTVVISLEDSFSDEGDALESFGDALFDTLCESAREYSDRVLIIFRLPRECTVIKKRIAEYFAGCSFVELTEDIMDSKKAMDCLTRIAARGAVAADQLLFDQITEGKTYLGSELQRIYKDWYNTKLKTDVFPQYSSVSEFRTKTVKEEEKGSAYKELASMIGLSRVKSVIEKALNFYKLQRIYKERGLFQTHPAMHMVFTGNPGTAKTTVARLFSRIMKENELLSRGHLVEVGRGDLVGRYVGWTAKTVEEKFRQADGGVLFIDEAYSLVDDRDGCFGDEAINTIVQQMENRRESMIVIFAGYPDKMESFLDKNPGLRSRIAFHVDFPDYSVDELCDIAKHVGKAKGLLLSEGAVSKLSEVFEAAKLSPDFGNGRYVRNVIEHTEMNMAARLLAIEPGKMTAEALTTITADDIDMPKKKTARREKHIGFGR